MLPIERLKKIEELLNENGSVMVNTLSELFNVSEETIRRDFEKLEKLNKLKRVRGGAYLAEIYDKSAPVRLREKLLIREKQLISERCLEMITHGDNIMLDSSTTALYVAKNIRIQGLKVTIITNSLQILQEFEEDKSAKVICVGGTLRPSAKSLIGYTATNNLNKYYADKAFISCSSINSDFGVSDNNEFEAMVRKQMLVHSEKKYLIVDNTKFDLPSPYHICSFNDLDAIITDKKIEAVWEEIARRYEMDLIYCEK